MISTRQSDAMAISILRMVAACWASFESKASRSSLVTPSTTAAICAPNSDEISPSVMWVSSAASCKSAPATVTSSRPRSATIPATAMGWMMYGSPDCRI